MSVWLVDPSFGEGYGRGWKASIEGLWSSRVAVEAWVRFGFGTMVVGQSGEGRLQSLWSELGRRRKKILGVHGRDMAGGRRRCAAAFLKNDA